MSANIAFDFTTEPYMHVPFSRLNPRRVKPPHSDVPAHQNLNDKLKLALQGPRGIAVQEMARRSTPK
ncbi:hypothetical protein M3I54_05200 [Paraburkholderia sp. CNPSo 3274]|uniref:hypothetical protein n=1 Tax=Paraburkholderia sp. CNPSo 3274 TaxID=2940932 RepID=UPI0020B6F0BA|nr:hypothetical protein [Paraburkholderia sp. CNPSo 3274]MCP3706388.1 hypothetical protein [Paraburkholderia sp. CNPSo 3274]